jgi:hypothetical protein
LAAPGSEGSARQRRAGSEGSEEGGIAFGDKYIISLREMENQKTTLRA